MINIKYYSDLDKYISYFHEIPITEDEKTLHTWIYGDTILAQAEVKAHSFKLISLNREEDYACFSIRLIDMMAKTLFSFCHTDEEYTREARHDMEKETLLEWVRKGGNPNTVAYSDGNPYSTILPYIYDIEVVKCFLDHGFDPLNVCVTAPIQGQFIPCMWTLEYLALTNNIPELLELLCEKNIPLNIPINMTKMIMDENPLKKVYGPEERIYLHPFLVAIRTKNINVMRFLLEKGKIDLSVLQLKTQSYLMAAVETGSIEMIELLLKAGAPLAPDESFQKVLNVMKNYALPPVEILQLFFSYLPLDTLTKKTWLKDAISIEADTEIIALLLEKCGDCLNLHEDTASPSPLFYAVSATSTHSIKNLELLLKAGAQFAPGETFMYTVAKHPNPIEIFTLLLQHLPVNTFLKKITSLNSSQLTLFLTAWTRLQGSEAPSAEVAENIIKNHQFIKILGHKFGIPLTLDVFFMDLMWKNSTEGGIRDINYNLDIQQSAEVFFTHHFTSLYPKIHELLADFGDEEELSLKQAAVLIKKYQERSTLKIRGNWPEHHAELIFHEDLLAVCNRGGLRESGTKAGIHFYRLKNPLQLTPELLLKIHTSPDLINSEEGRKKLGLSERLTTFIEKEQPGGFCLWNNAKLGFKLLLALARLPDQVEGDLVEAIWECYNETQKIYKKWSEFDLEKNLSHALEFYEKNPSVNPPLSLLLFILAKYKGKNLDPLAAFLKKQNITLSDCVQEDKNGKNMLHRLYSSNNLNALNYVTEELTSKRTKIGVIPLLIDSLCNQYETPLYKALCKNRMKAAFELVKRGAKINEVTESLLMIQLAWNNDLPLLLKFCEIGAHLTRGDYLNKTVLHYAIQFKSTHIISYYMEHVVLTEKDLIEYIQHAKKHKNQEAFEMLVK